LRKRGVLVHSWSFERLFVTPHPCGLRRDRHARNNPRPGGSRKPGRPLWYLRGAANRRAAVDRGHDAATSRDSRRAEAMGRAGFPGERGLGAIPPITRTGRRPGPTCGAARSSSTSVKDQRRDPPCAGADREPARTGARGWRIASGCDYASGGRRETFAPPVCADRPRRFASAKKGRPGPARRSYPHSTGRIRTAEKLPSFYKAAAPDVG